MEGSRVGGEGERMQLQGVGGGVAEEEPSQRRYFGKLRGGGGSDQGSEGGNGVGRARSLTDDDLEELKACLDLGFGFTYDEIPELCKTLPALVLCFSLSRSLFLFLSPSTSTATVASSPIANGKISGPGEMNLLSSFFPSPAREGDQPEEVKARLKFWAQAVACTVRLCS
ncbi:unnamed protein product [Musa acuminata var. zebrina]